MDRLDARRYRLQLPLHDGGRLAFRVTRGTFSTIERDAKAASRPRTSRSAKPAQR